MSATQKEKKETKIILNIQPVFSEVVKYLYDQDIYRLVTTSTKMQKLLHEEKLTVRRKLF